jgi:hypothetical protein
MQWYLETLPHWKRVHLLGVSELTEIQAWLPFTRFLQLSVDTGKPVKYGLLGKRLSELRSPRRASLNSRALLEQDSWSPQQVTLVKKNVAYLRSLLLA